MSTADVVTAANSANAEAMPLQQAPVPLFKIPEVLSSAPSSSSEATMSDMSVQRSREGDRRSFDSVVSSQSAWSALKNLHPSQAMPVT